MLMNKKKQNEQDRAWYQAMIMLLVLGILLFAGGVVLVWKLGVWDIESFYGVKKAENLRVYYDVLEYSILFYSPCIVGMWLIVLAVKSLRQYWKK